MIVPLKSSKLVPQEIKLGCKALDDFMTSFNSRDAMAWGKTLNYPHMRLAGDEVQVWESPEAYAKDNDTKALAEKRDGVIQSGIGGGWFRHRKISSIGPFSLPVTPQKASRSNPQSLSIF